MILLDKILELAPMIAGSYPNSFFYEADTVMTETDNGEIGPEVDPVSTKLVWGTTDGKTVVVTFDKDETVHVDCVDEPWLEDVPMTPYISMGVDTALETLNTANFITSHPLLTLRHSLHPGIAEPHYYFKAPKGFYAVGVYSGTVTCTE